MKISPPVRLTCRPVGFGERALEHVERQFLAPFAFDIEQRADVAELAVQVAPHRRFVDDAGGQAARAAVARLEERRGCVLRTGRGDTAPAGAWQRESTARGVRGVRGSGRSRASVERPDIDDRARPFQCGADPRVGVVDERRRGARRRPRSTPARYGENDATSRASRPSACTSADIDGSSALYRFSTTYVTARTRSGSSAARARERRPARRRSCPCPVRRRQDRSSDTPAPDTASSASSR